MISCRRNVSTPITTSAALLGIHSTGELAAQIQRTLLYVSCSLIHPFHHTSLSSISRPLVRQPVSHQYGLGPYLSYRSLDYLNPLTVACHLLTCSMKPTLDSPVNRAQAHNPFGKRHSQHSIASENAVDVGAYIGSSPSPSPLFTRMVTPLELPALPPSVSPSASLVSLSPATIPLPSPSPDEATELDSVN